MIHHKFVLFGETMNISRVRATRRPDYAPFQSLDTANMRDKATGWSVLARTIDDPVFVVRRRTPSTGRIESFDGTPYTQDMPIAIALGVLRELTKEDK
jgi:hypothetical protein